MILLLIFLVMIFFFWIRVGFFDNELFCRVNLFFSLNFFGLFFNGFMQGDSFSVGLISLSLWIGLLMLLASLRFDRSKAIFREFMGIIIILVFLLLFTFSFSSLFLFYVGFEFTIVPTFLLILGWGYRVERFQAGLYIFIYTLMASLPFLLLLFNLINKEGSMDFTFLFFNRAKGLGGFWWVYVSLVFMVKLPAALVHLWLPKAHVEAPLAGSMVLAGVLLKLGGYGFIRCFNFCVKDFFFVRRIFESLGLLGGLFIRFICMRQVDLKCLVAYSSVAHMGIVICGLFCFMWIGRYGGYLIILSHGICSSGLFCLLNLIYERWGSRSIVLMKGGVMCAPILSFWWFRLCVGNISCPPRFNFISEVLVLMRVLTWDILIIRGLFFFCY